MEFIILIAGMFLGAILSIIVIEIISIQKKEPHICSYDNQIIDSNKHGVFKMNQCSHKGCSLCDVDSIVKISEPIIK